MVSGTTAPQTVATIGLDLIALIMLAIVGEFSVFEGVCCVVLVYVTVLLGKKSMADGGTL
jgi:hypothetical protein